MSDLGHPGQNLGSDLKTLAKNLSIEKIVGQQRAVIAGRTPSEEAMPEEPQGGESQEGNEPSSGESKTFTQADLDRIVSERLAREKAKFADYDELKSAAEKLRSIEEANQSEAEKLSTKLAERERELEDMRKAHTEQRIESALMTAAIATGVIDPDAAVKLVDRSAVTLDESGQVTNAKALVETLTEQRPWLKNQGRTAGSADGGVRSNGTTQTTDMNALLRAAATGRR